MRTLTAAADAAASAEITRPGYFVEIEFSTAVRLYTRSNAGAAITWNGHTWTPAHCEVTGLANDGTPNQSGQLRITDSGDEYVALVLAEGTENRAIRVWSFFGTAPANADPVLEFDGVIDGHDYDSSSYELTLGMRQGEVRYAPATLINSASGFSVLPPNGKQIPWGGQVYALSRGS